MHDFVGLNYFSDQPEETLKTVIKLLEHVVVIEDLIKDEVKLNSMYQYYNTVTINLPYIITAMKLNDIVDRWRARLYCKEIERLKSSYFDKP